MSFSCAHHSGGKNLRRLPVHLNNALNASVLIGSPLVLLEKLNRRPPRPIKTQHELCIKLSSSALLAEIEVILLIRGQVLVLGKDFVKDECCGKVDIW